MNLTNTFMSMYKSEWSAKVHFCCKTWQPNTVTMTSNDMNLLNGLITHNGDALRRRFIYINIMEKIGCHFACMANPYALYLYE